MAARLQTRHARGWPGHPGNLRSHAEAVGCSTEAGAEESFKEVKKRDDDLPQGNLYRRLETSEEVTPLERAMGF